MTIDTPLLDSLRASLGAGAVSTVPDALERSSHDTWPLSTKEARRGVHAHQAEAVVTLATMDEIGPVLKLAAEHDIPVTVRGLGSSVTGQPLPVRGGIVLDLSQVPAHFDVDATNLTVTVDASHQGGALEDALNELGFTLGHSPQSLYRSTVGGWLATLATGQFSSLYGGIEDLTVGYRVVLATGEAVELSAAPRAAMGPDLRQIFIGSEGTLGVITSVTLKIFPLPEAQILQTFSFPTVEAGLAMMREQASLAMRPFLLRFYDTDEARHAMKDPRMDTPVMFVGSRGPRALAEAEMQVLTSIATAHGGIPLGPAGAEGWMARRFDFSTVEGLLELEGGFAETIEVAHNWSDIAELYDALKAALQPLADEVLAHFSHVYTQGTSMYVILLGRVDDDAEAVARLRTIWSTAMEVCLDHGAELSHHHGGGLARSPYARRSLGSAHIVLQRVKAALDPSGILNPGKLGL